MHDLQSIFTTKLYPIRNKIQIYKSFGQGGWIPTRLNAFPILTVLQESSPFGQYATVERSIFQYCLKREMFDVSGSLIDLCKDGFFCHIEF